MPEVPNIEPDDSLVATKSTDEAVQDLGDAVEDYLSQTEELGHPPDLQKFLAEYPDLGDELRNALEGLAMMRGLLSSGGSTARLGSSSPNTDSPETTLLKPGYSLAGYRIVRELGRGGMGVVYEAVHVDLDRPVALKILKPWSGGSARRRFINEARTSAGLHHTNIVPVFDVGQSGSTCYYAMQKIDGEGLDWLIRRRRGESVVKHLPVAISASTQDFDKTPNLENSSDHENRSIVIQKSKSGGQAQGSSKPSDQIALNPDWYGFTRWVAQIGCQAAMALDYAHKRQVIHRDIKPSNLILDTSGTIWVADFGLALRLDDPGLSRGDGVLGTPRYTSPEQAARKVVDHRTDIYSLGATLYELLTSRPPFDGETSDDVIRKILTESPAPPHLIEPRISRDLETIVLKAMARRPEDRYATGAELADDLERFLRYEPVKARRIGAVGRMWRLSQRHPAVTLVSVVAVSVIIGIASFAYRRVMIERDDALLARVETQAALDGEKTALGKARSAMRNQLWREASLVRMSAVPDRRRTILNLVQEAVAYDPEPELKAKLRDEVVAALSLSDVHPELSLVEDRLAGFEMITGDDRAATVSGDRKSLIIWDITTGKKRSEVLLEKLFEGSAWLDARDQSGPGRGGPDNLIPGGVLSRRSTLVMVSIGPMLGVVRPDGRSIIWVDSQTAEPRGEWRSPDQNTILAVQPVGAKSRILTIEFHPDLTTPGSSSGRVFPFGPLRPTDEFLICIHDLDKPESKPLILERIKPAAERGRFIWPVLSISPDGGWVAVSHLFEEQIRILDTSDGRELGSLSAQVPVSTIAAGPQRLLAVAGGGSIRLWRNEIKQEKSESSWSAVALPTLGTQLGVIRQIRFAPDRNMIAASGRTSGIELWDVDSGEAVATLATTGQADHLAFTASGDRLLASFNDARKGGLRTWSINEPLAKRLVATTPEPVINMALHGSENSPTILAQTLTGQVWYDVPGEGPMRQLHSSASKDRFSTVRTDPQGRLWTLHDRTVKRWDQWTPESPDLVNATADFSLPEQADDAWSMRGFGLTRMPSGLVFASQSGRTFTSRGAMLYLLDPVTGNQFAPIVPDSSERQGFPQNQRAGRDENPAEREKSERRKSQGQPDTERKDRDRGRPEPPPPRPDQAFGNMAGFRGFTPFSKRLNVVPEGDQIALIRGNSWEFWEIEQHQQTATGPIWTANKKPIPSGSPTTDVNALALSPDGTILALGNREGVVTLIHVRSWKVSTSFRVGTVEEPDSNVITDLSFMPGNQSFLAVVGRREISIWDLNKPPTRYLSLPVDNPSTTPVVWGPKGHELFVVEEDKRIVKWDLQRIGSKIEELGLK